MSPTGFLWLKMSWWSCEAQEVVAGQDVNPTLPNYHAATSEDRNVALQALSSQPGPRWDCLPPPPCLSPGSAPVFLARLMDSRFGSFSFGSA